MRLIAVVSVIVLFGCRKEPVTLPPPETARTSPVEKGFPAQSNRASGHMLCGLFQTIYGLHNVRYFAAFSDPPVKPLSLVPMTLFFMNIHVSGNINVGAVRCNGESLGAHSPGVSYSRMEVPGPSGAPDSSYWSLEGNGSFQPEGIRLPSPPPGINRTVVTYTVKPGKDLIINLRSLVKGYDSAFATIYPEGVHIWRLAGSDSVFRVPAALIANAMKLTGSPKVIAEGVRYYHKYSNGKLYLFWQSAACERRVHVLPP